MTTHVIEAVIRRFYKVYVEDENDTMTSAEAKQQARKQIEEDGEAAITEDIELNEVVALPYGYPTAGKKGMSGI